MIDFIDKLHGELKDAGITPARKSCFVMPAGCCVGSCALSRTVFGLLIMCSSLLNIIAIELVERRKEILEKLQNSQAEAQKVMDVIENPEVISALRQDKLQNLQFLKDNYGVCNSNHADRYLWSYRSNVRNCIKQGKRINPVVFFLRGNNR